MARPVTPLMRLEDARVEWRAMKRDLIGKGQITPTIAATVEWIDDVLANLGTLIDSTRMVVTIFGCGEMVYSETVKQRFDELEIRQQFRRTA